MTRTRLLALAALVLAAGCHGCFPPAPPDLAAYERLGDLYDGAPPEESVPPFDRALAVVGAAAHELRYGELPVQVLRRHHGEGWVLRQSVLLAKGDVDSVENAHHDLVETWAGGFSVPGELKLRLRQGESRLNDFLSEPRSDLEKRAAYLAEIAWALYLVGSYGADAGW